MGLMDVRGLAERSMRAIVASREAGGPFRSVQDLMARVPLARDEAENLALGGALDALAGNRPQALWQVHALLDAPPPPSPLLAGAGPAPGPPPCPPLEDFSPLQKLQVEQHVLGMTPSANPMAVYLPLMEAGPGGGLPPGRRGAAFCRTVDLPARAGQEATVAGLLFAERRARTRDGQFMKFISLEDPWGVVEAVLLPDAYQRLGGRITTRGPYVVTGTVEDHFGAVSLLVTDLRPARLADRRQPAEVA